MPQPPININEVVHAITMAASAIASVIIANPLVALFALAGLAILAELPPIAVLLGIIAVVSYLIAH